MVSITFGTGNWSVWAVEDEGDLQGHAKFRDYTSEQDGQEKSDSGEKYGQTIDKGQTANLSALQ